MEHSQLSQMVTWLDKEHQRDRTELNQLQQQVETLTGENDAQVKRIAELEMELATLRAHVDRVGQIEDHFGRFKQEMSAFLDDSSTRRQQALRDSERVRQLEIDNITKTLNEIRKDVERLRRYEEELTAHRVETQRLSETVARLQQQILDVNKSQDERAHNVAYLEEQRHQDNKRIAQLQAQTTDLLKKAEIQSSQIQHLEQLSVRVNELKSSIEELHQQQNKYLEKVQFQDAQRERHMKNWREEADLYRQRMDEYERRMESYSEQHQRAKRATEALQEFKAQIQRQQHETAELQRLAENRQRSQFEEWQAQEEQRRQKQTMEWEHQWNESDRILSELTGQVTALEKRVLDNEKLLHSLIEAIEEDAQTRIITARDWQIRFEELVEQE